MEFLSLPLTICSCIYTSITLFTAIVATDTLTPYQRLKNGQTLVSSNQRFELGFFTPSSQTNTRYLGIWYKDISPLTVVWVANRTKPLKNLDTALMIDFNGRLSLEDRAHNLVSLSIPEKPVSNPVLQLLDSGNLVVRDDGGGYLWQSFDYPGDTLLPGMKIGWDYKTGLNRVMTSWKDNGDPSSGDFTLGLDTPALPQLVLERSSIKQSRWGPWDGIRFSGTLALEKTNPVFHPVFTTNSDGVHFTYDMVDGSVLLRFVVTQLGKVQFLTWKNCTQEWIPMVTLNKDSCEGYGSCGPYGICYVSEPNCQCLKGFEANSSGDWNGISDWTDGCKRNFDLKCEGDGFVKFEGLKLPDNGTLWASQDSNECERNCLLECNCMAYTHLDVYGNGSSVCVVWFNELFDMRSFPRGGDNLYIRMARAELDSIALAKMEKNQTLISLIFTSTATGIAFLGFLIAWCRFKIKCVSRQGRKESSNSSRHSNGNQEENLDFRHFDIQIISTATNNFSNDNKIGQGGFGPVYKGELPPNGRQIAVKRLSKSSRQGVEQFENESSLISKLQHRNLVKLVGCCVYEEERMLVYEYLVNKSLDKFIFAESERRRLLPWAKRFDIIIGVAKGLVYLHDDSGLRIVHRDLKASNILLDSEMMPKISDFGLAKILGGEDRPEETTRRVIGTYGYMSPEYAMHGQFSTKSDVFSFGVLVLEIISGQKNWRFHHPDHDLNLLGHGWNLWKEGKALELVDPAMEDPVTENEILRCAQVGLLCAQHKPEDRPAMSTVVCMLGNENMEFPDPSEPGFLRGCSSMEIGSPSANGLTITTLSAR